MYPSDKETGRCSVYVMFAKGFHGPLRPSHDSAVHDLATMTPKQVATLRNMVSRYMENCRLKNGTGNPEA